MSDLRAPCLGACSSQSTCLPTDVHCSLLAHLRTDALCPFCETSRLYLTGPLVAKNLLTFLLQTIQSAGCPFSISLPSSSLPCPSVLQPISMRRCPAPPASLRASGAPHPPKLPGKLQSPARSCAKSGTYMLGTTLATAASKSGSLYLWPLHCSEEKG